MTAEEIVRTSDDSAASVDIADINEAYRVAAFAVRTHAALIDKHEPVLALRAWQRLNKGELLWRRIGGDTLKNLLAQEQPHVQPVEITRTRKIVL